MARIAPLDLGEHAVEGRGEHAEFIRVADLDPLGEAVSFRGLLGDSHNSEDRPGDTGPATSWQHAGDGERDEQDQAGIAEVGPQQVRGGRDLNGDHEGADTFAGSGRRLGQRDGPVGPP